MGEHLREWEKDKIAKEIAAGKTMVEIAEDYGISKSTAYSVREQRKQMIEAEQMRWLAVTPAALDIQIDLINSFDKSTSISNPKLFDAGIKAVENNLKSSGILPSPTTINLTQINTGKALSPAVEATLSRLFGAVASSIAPTTIGASEAVDVDSEEIIE